MRSGLCCADQHCPALSYRYSVLAFREYSRGDRQASRSRSAFACSQRPNPVSRFETLDRDRSLPVQPFAHVEPIRFATDANERIFGRILQRSAIKPSLERPHHRLSFHVSFEGFYDFKRRPKRNLDLALPCARNEEDQVTIYARH